MRKDFDDFDKRFNDFDKHFKRTEKVIWFSWIFSTVIGLGLLGFFIWVVIMLLRFFGVV